MVSVSLFGSQKDVIGWLRLLEQERVPFQYKGAILKGFSDINILVGFNQEEVKVPSRGVYILEPNLNPWSEKGKTTIVRQIKDEDIGSLNVHCIASLREQQAKTFGQFQLHEVYCDLGYPVVIQKKNTFIFSTNLSSQLHFQGFGYKRIDNFSDKYLLEVHTTLVDKEKILRFLRKILIEAFGLADLPYIHVWYYPTFSSTIFLFRQDVDYVDEEGIKNLSAVTEKYGIRGTYFININGGEEFEDAADYTKLAKPATPERKGVLKKLLTRSNELANHGYWHDVFDNFEDNYKNIKKCSVYLKKLFGIQDKGFAAPGGIWHSELARAIDQRGFLYASNGTLDCGGFPYYPYYAGRKAKTLEIPFNLVGDASFELAFQPSDIKALKKFYLKLVDEQLNNNEPVAIMGHPHLIGKVAGSFFPPLFTRILKLKIPNYNLEEFAQWWKRREKINLFYEKRRQKITVKSDTPSVIIETVFREKKKLLKLNKKKLIINTNRHLTE